MTRYIAPKALEFANLIPSRGEVAFVREFVESSEGILDELPEGIPRSFLQPGCRMGFYPEDLLAFGSHRGFISERWFGSDTRAENGPETMEFEGIGKFPYKGKWIPLSFILQEFGERVMGPLYGMFGGRLGFYNKIFDFADSINWHIHQRDGMGFSGGVVSPMGKMESYVHPYQLNSCFKTGTQVATWFGLRPGTTREEILDDLKNWDSRPSRILGFSQALLLSHLYNWMIPSGYGHAPGSLATIELQQGTDLFGMWQNHVNGRPTPKELLLKNYDPSWRDNLEWLASQVDLKLNATDPTRFMIIPSVKRRGDGWVETWETYGVDEKGRTPFTLLKTVIDPGMSVMLKDPGLYNLYCIEGSGTIATPTGSVVKPLTAQRVIYFGQPTNDAYVITHDRAVDGVTFSNTGTGPMVLYRGFGCNAFSAEEIPAKVTDKLEYDEPLPSTAW